MFLSGVIWTKSFELFAHQRGRKPSCLVLLGVAREVLFFFKSSSVLLLLCKYIFVT